MENQEIVHPVDMPAATTAQVPPAAPITNSVIQRQKESGMRGIVVVLLLLIIIGAGVGTGFGVSRLIKLPTSPTTMTGSPGSIDANQIEVGKTYGTEDVKKYPDTSEGIIVKGGIDGEGTHHLDRAGGVSQTVYLTSSILDLDLFEGDKVQIRGETFSAQKAAWFMDVSSVKVIELGDAKPTEPTTPVGAD